MEARLPPSKVLVVDDTPAQVRVLLGAFDSTQEVVVATSGEQALELARSERPDLILLDVVMPDLDGHEVCRRLKADPGTADIPIIFITGKDEASDVSEGLELGAVDYLAKPFSLPLVKARLKTHLELKRCRDRLEDLSFQDGLTGLSNRRRFDGFLEFTWRQCMRQQSPLALVLLDVDHFEAYNEHHGHPAGDECLRRIGQALREAQRRDTDLTARYGGEVFAIVMPATDLEGAAGVGERLRSLVQALAMPHAGSSTAPCVTASLGAAARVPDIGDLPSALVGASIQALYQAKRLGRNRLARASS